MAITDELARRFVCAKCRASGGVVKTVPTISGWSVLFGGPSSSLLAVSCKGCGYTELFDADTLNRNRKGGAIFDSIYGEQRP
ncbi:zinc ribbon domain-containing protein [Limnoglobus roseus]|uniref:Uncharacterized protein n=1 Tax=Limnoglobus roseus TaxID=2598579 RepID=A0A5C1ALX7_9BACT|nr:zinc ribbon domain-containing protein [Limnoglobus roseus]QEL19163.1 hypothetical protein PX52LOC_06221 [Limnoglobus roseus]